MIKLLNKLNMPVTFVTSFIDLNLLEDFRVEDKKLSFYLEKSKLLLKYPYNFVVFVDKNTHQLLANEKQSNIEYIIVDIKDLPSYSILKDSVLPSFSSVGKDSYNFLILMISKTFFIEKAIEYNPYKTDFFSWIDFGILKIVNHNELDIFSNSLKKINEYNEPKIRIPGCPFYINNIREYSSNILFQQKDRPCWFFCGGFFTGDKRSLLEFSKEVNNILYFLQEKKFITWEVNIWTFINFKNKNLFDVYYADHNITMFSNF
jgi:hypothetical protein